MGKVPCQRLRKKNSSRSRNWIMGVGPIGTTAVFAETVVVHVLRFRLEKGLETLSRTLGN